MKAIAGLIKLILTPPIMKHLTQCRENLFLYKILKEKLPGSVVVTIEVIGVVDTNKLKIYTFVLRTIDNFTFLSNEIKQDSKKDLFLF